MAGFAVARNRHGVPGPGAGPTRAPVEKAETGPTAFAVRFARTRRHDEAGTCVLRTSRVDRDIDTVPRTCRRRTDIKATFRSSRSEPGLRPIWQQLDKRIAVLACHAVRLIRTWHAA